MKLGMKSIISLAFVIIVLLVMAFSAASIFDSNKSGWFTVKQAAVSGKMSVIFSEGVFGQWWGTLNRYPNSDTYYFSAEADEGAKRDESIPVTFKNGSIGQVSGSVRMTYPRSEKSVIELHRRYRSHNGAVNDLVRTEIRKLVNMTASLMSPEAAMTQKGLFQQMFVDQIQNGQYQTEAAKEEFEDPVTKEKTWKDVVNIKYAKGKPLRLENPFSKAGVTISQEVIQNIDPDPKTKQMIGRRRDAEMSVMVAKAAVEKARQDEQKVIAEGKRAVAEKEYKALQKKKLAVVNAEREKEVAIIQAQQQVEVNERALEAAKLDRAKATEEKMAMIERGKGEAQARKLVMEADNALDRKLKTYEAVMGKFAEAYSRRAVPTIVSGGDGKNQDASFMTLMEMFGYKVATDLALDLKSEKGK